MASMQRNETGMNASPAFRLLLIEDSQADADLLTDFVTDLNAGAIEMVRAKSLAEAHPLLSQGDFDAAVLDLNLPDSRGAATLLSFQTSSPDLPVVVTSGVLNEPRLRAQLQDGGATLLLDKNELRTPLAAKEFSSFLRGVGQESLRRQFHDLVAAVPDAVLVADNSGVIRYVNSAGCALFGKSEQDLIGERMSFSLKRGSGEIEVARGGETRVAEVRVVEFIWERRPANLALIRDVTETRRLNDQLRQAQKMEAVGLLAGGVAHDFNNLLQAMSLFVGILQDKLHIAESRLVELDEISRAIDRAKGLTRQLLTFSRNQPAELRTLNLQDVIAGVHSMLRRMLPASIAILREDGPAISQICADRGHIEQVVMNLAINARDAMPNGGRLTIMIGNEVVGQGSTRAPPGEYVALRISDTGCGMPPDVLERIFEPFFTTKQRGKGSGLGLAICYGIVTQANGRIWATSTPGAGSEFTVLIPKSLETIADAGATTPGSLTAPIGGAERILVVEDDQAVMRATTQILTLAGYSVSSAENGEEALELLHENVERFDLILSDVDMPLIGGPELASLVRKLRPDLPVVLMSGYSNHAVDRHDDENHIRGNRLLLKPFDRRSLLGFVREGLELHKKEFRRSA